jgi:hypothetical protein
MHITATDERVQSAHTGQGIRWSVRGTIALSALLLGASTSDAQHQLPFKVTIVDWKPETMARQSRWFSANTIANELLFCVVSWREHEPEESYQRITIDSTRREATGNHWRIDGAAKKCLDDRGWPLPTIHTHVEGNCQPSPADLITIAARGAPFDGIQCGAHHITWLFAWQVKALINWVQISQRLP